MIRSAMALATMVLLGCSPEHRVFQKKTNELQGSPEFKLISRRIFEPHCVRCHGHYSDENAVFRELSNILNAVEADRMPKGGPPLSANLKEELKKWAAESPEIPEPKLEPKWKSLSANVFTPRCVICHSENGQAKFLLLNDRNAIYAVRDKYLNFEMPEQSLLIDVLQDDEEPMPPIESNIRRLTETEISVLVEWIRLGLP